MRRANTMSTITVELTIKVKSKFTSSNAERPNGFISPQMSKIFTYLVVSCDGPVVMLGGVECCNVCFLSSLFLMATKASALCGALCGDCRVLPAPSVNTHLATVTSSPPRVSFGGWLVLEFVLFFVLAVLRPCPSGSSVLFRKGSRK